MNESINAVCPASGCRMRLTREEFPDSGRSGAFNPTGTHVYKYAYRCQKHGVFSFNGRRFIEVEQHAE